MAGAPRVICPSADLIEGGKGVRFTVSKEGGDLAAFVVRYDGLPRAFINRCQHVPVELDWMEGEFFDHSGLYLVCATHGATYLPESGYCVAGPCKGRRLTPLAVSEIDGQVLLTE